MAESLAAQGVSQILGIPGAQLDPAADALYFISLNLAVVGYPRHDYTRQLIASLSTPGWFGTAE
ncbi:hypothetical protein AB0M95_38240 [Sphaerisporangium sp. NPDC051017]|uniref:hypothetical protein n=1 Tax=Sphaerisporangium sp. NPDC051017 TaxID=3154636 RepID=UPI00343F70AB